MTRLAASVASLFVLTGCLRPAEGPVSVPSVPTGSPVPTAPNEAQATGPAQPAPKGGPWPWQGGRAVSVSIDAKQTLREVTPLHFGHNTSWWAGKGWTLDPDRLEKARQAGMRFWRWPGGSSSDEYVWDGNVGKWGNGPPGKNSGHMTESWAANTDDFLSMIETLDGEMIITLNYGLARYGSLDQAIELAKSWVKYLNVDKGLKVKYFEIGNELHGPWETGHNVPGKPELTGKIYGADVRAFCKAIKSVDPSVLCGADAVVEDNGEEWTGYKWWMRDLLPEIADAVDFLIVHEYFGWPFQNDQFVSPSNDAIFANVRKVKQGASAIAAMTQKYTKRTTPFPLAFTEFNILNGNVPQTIELINGLFTAEVLGEAIEAGYVATNYWDWKNGYDAKHGGGDHALLASSDPAVPDNTPRPAYYAYAIFARAFGNRTITATSSDPSLKIYASTFQGKSDLGVVLVNEKEEAAKLTFTGVVGKTKLTGWVLTGAGLNARQVTFNGEPGPAGGGGPFPIDKLAPYTKALDGADSFVVTLPPASLTGLVLAE